jgi:uncharacterized protein
MSNMATVKEIYAAFGRGDIEGILSRLADDVRWDLRSAEPPAGVPWLAPRRGRDEVAAFFASLAGLEFQRFDPVTLLEGGDQVAAFIDVEATVRDTGGRIVDSEAHLWTFDREGRVTELRHYVDTAQHIVAVGAGVAS